MKKKFLSIIALVLCLIMAGSSVNAMAGTKAQQQKTTKDFFTTSISSSNDTVTVNVSLNKKSDLTNGRIALYYDPAVMTLQYGYASTAIGTIDINEDIEKDGKKGISVAWISSSAAKSSTSILSLTFKVKKAYNKQVVSVETDAIEAYQDGTPVAYDGTTTSSTTLKIKKSIIDMIVDLISPFLPGFGGRNSYTGYLW